jgi:HEAT repeat protein
MAEMRDPRTLPALLKALEWRSEVSEDHAVAAARTMVDIQISDDKRGEVVEAICTALKRIDGARGVDNRMRKAFIEVLGKLKDKRASETLVEIALKQDESQNFLFNKLAAQQLVAIADPSTVDAMVKALYTFDLAQPAMRMMEDAEAVLVAIGKPALEPLLKARKGENEAVNKLVELSIDAFRRVDPDVAGKMNKEALVAREATLALGRLGFTEALDALLDEASQAHPDRRATAALALVGIRVPPKDEKRLVDAMIGVYEKSEKQGRPGSFRQLFLNQPLASCSRSANSMFRTAASTYACLALSFPSRRRAHAVRVL